jgi:hypothetical protein
VSGYGVKINDSVAIPEPFLQIIDFTYKNKVKHLFVILSTITNNKQNRRDF